MKGYHNRRRARAKKGFSGGDLGLFKKAIEINPDALRVVIEGDSWLAYPSPWLVDIRYKNLAGHILKGLRDKIHVNSYFCATNGDKVSNMLTEKSKDNLLYTIATTKPDYILFSGGGNDILDSEVLSDYFTSTSKINWGYIEKKLDSLHRLYKGFMKDLNKVSPDTKVLAHTYDYLIPRDKGTHIFGIGVAGPWLYPVLNYHGMTKKAQKQFVKNLIDNFADYVLKPLKDTFDNFDYVDTRGVLEAKDFQDEIHPTNKGFEKLSKKWLEVIK